jgi:hydroxymethylbilane synthase
VDTRIRKLDTMGLDAVVLAAAGVKRMKLEGSISQFISPEVCLPAIGQGALGIETRVADDGVNQDLSIIDHEATHIAITAERARWEEFDQGRDRGGDGKS